MKKYNVFEEMETIEMRNAQIVYLREILKMGYQEIADKVGLAVSTVKNYVRKFNYLLEKAKQWFGEVATKIVTEIKTKIDTNKLITYECEHKKGDCAYIIEYFNSQKEFCFLKVGMTNNIDRRIKEHLRDYTKKGYDTTYAIVKKLYYAEDEEDALTIENCLRKHYKNIENCGFIKRDRFQFVRFNNEDLQNDSVLNNRLTEFVMA